jgi:4-carboxymuconolactone decarboxylase
LDTVSQRIITLSESHPEHEQLILLSAISILWLKPQNPDAKALLEHYRQRKLSYDMLYESALQLFLIAGFQASLEAVFQMEEVFGPVEAKAFSETACEPSAMMQRGLELQSQVYRQNVEKLRTNLNRVSPELADWTVLIGYGLVLSRPGLPSAWRELLEVAVLSAQGFPRQLHSHLRGALNLGAAPAEVELILKVGDLLNSPENSKSAWQIWIHVKA